VVIAGNDGCPVISLLKALFEDWTFFMVKTKDLTILVSPNSDGVCALNLHGGAILEKLFRSLGVATTSSTIAAVRQCLLWRGLYSFLLFYFLDVCILNLF
jgi:hypothetical protein